MIKLGTVISSLGFALAVSCFVGRPRVSILRRISNEQTDQTLATTRLLRLPGWMKEIGASQWRIGALLALIFFLLAGQSIIAAIGGCGVGAAAIAALRWSEAITEHRRNQRLSAQLPICLELLVATLAAGLPLRAGIRHIAGLVPEPSAGLLNGVLNHIDLGRSDAQGWEQLEHNPVWGPVARDLSRCASSGAGLSEILTVHASEARARTRAKKEQIARTAGVKSVLPLVCCFLPAFILIGVVPIVASTLQSVLHLK